MQQGCLNWIDPLRLIILTTTLLFKSMRRASARRLFVQRYTGIVFLTSITLISVEEKIKSQVISQ